MSALEALHERWLEPPEDKVFGYCKHCGGEIYDGETYYLIDGENICEDCLSDFASKYFADCVEEASICCERF